MFPRPPLLAAGRSVMTRGRRPPPARSSPNAIPSSSKILDPLSTSASTTSASTASSSASSSSSSSIMGDGSIKEGGGSYHVGRSSGGELPVYSKFRNGGGVTTIVRKVETLQSQLNAYFAQSHIDPFSHPPSVTIRPTNGHLQVKGHWVEEVKGWLEGKGF
ncbi:hypothetical protein IAR55_000846 [Kwoniella newhampshirensis]|uniref:Large ribosomal subunit protein mL49 n=1 Tax=Kwoniella newhampshirensis TaxID=1651941 RepID=A0AAW0Z4B8_9TREE